MKKSLEAIALENELANLKELETKATEEYNNNPDKIREDWDTLYKKFILPVKNLEKKIDKIAPILEVGDGVSLKGYSDVAPYEVIEVSKSGKSATIRQMKATLDPSWKPEMIPGGFSAHCTNNHEQKWNLESDPEGSVVKISLRTVKLDPRYNHGNDKATKWVPVGVKAKIGEYPVIYRAMKFYDYNF